MSESSTKRGTLVNNQVGEDSSSESSSESEAGAAIIKPLSKSPAKASPLIAATKKMSDSSSDSSDDDTPVNKNIQSKVAIKPLTKASPLAGASKKVPDSSSDSSDSSDDDTPANKNIQSKVAITSLARTLTKATPLSGASKKVSDSSSESSSESESQPHKSHASVAANSVSSKGSIKVNTRTPKIKKQSSVSEEESRSMNSNNAAGDAQPFSKNQRMEQQTFANNQNQSFNSQFGGASSAASDNTRKHKGPAPYRRIPDDSYVDSRLQESAQLAKQSLSSFKNVRGKEFKHEKTKKKRKAHPMKIDTTVKSIPFND